MTEVSNKKSNLSRYIVPSIKNDVENIPAYITKNADTSLLLSLQNGPFICLERNIQIISRSARYTIVLSAYLNCHFDPS